MYVQLYKYSKVNSSFMPSCTLQRLLQFNIDVKTTRCTYTVVALIKTYIKWLDGSLHG